MTIFEECARKYEAVTDDKFDPGKCTIAMGEMHSYTTHQAMESLKYEPTGTLGTLLLLKSWNEYVKEKLFSLQNLIEGNFSDKIDAFKAFDHYMHFGPPSQLLHSMMESLYKIAKPFNVDVKDFYNINNNKFIDILQEAYQNIYVNYSVKVFLCDNTVDNEPVVIPYICKFKDLNELVQFMRRSDNCIVYAEIDSMYKEEDNIDFTDKLMLFAMRVRDKVYINGDMPFYPNMRSRNAIKRRNPYKAFHNKADYTWMPYSLQNKNVASEVNKALTTDVSYSGPLIREMYDEEARTIIVLSMLAMYQKYWKDPVEDVKYSHLTHQHEKVLPSYFGEDIELLPANTSKDLSTYCTTYVPTPTLIDISQSHPTLKFVADDYYNWYIKNYITEADIAPPIKVEAFVGSEQEASFRVWEEQRYRAVQIAAKRMREAVGRAYVDPENPLHDYIVDESFYEGFSLPPINYIKSFSPLEKVTANGLPFILRRLWGMDENMNTSRVVEKLGFAPSDLHVLRDHITDPDVDVDTINMKRTFYKWGDPDLKYIRDQAAENGNYMCATGDLEGFRVYMDIHGGIDIWDDAYDKAQYNITLFVNTAWDLAHIFGCDRQQLPVIWQRYFKDNSYAPYMGNSLLDYTDPIMYIEDPINESLYVRVHVYLCKKSMHRLMKLFNITEELSFEVVE